MHLTALLEYFDTKLCHSVEQKLRYFNPFAMGTTNAVCDLLLETIP